MDMASGNSQKRHILDLQDDEQLNIKWQDVTCPICLEFPHNCVLLHCSSYDKGCRPFVCDTNHNHSNCLDRFKAAYRLPGTHAKDSSLSNEALEMYTIPSNMDSCPTCPLCRGTVTGWAVIDEARVSLNAKKRCCEERECSYVGSYIELQTHAKENHPDARPSEVDPARRLDWENFQRSSEIIDLLSTIQSETPNGVVLGDYVVEYGDESGDEYEDFPGDEGNWWTSCILYQVFDNFRTSRSRQRSREFEFRRRQQRSAFDVSNGGDGSISPPRVGNNSFDDSDDEFVNARSNSEGVSSSSSSTGRRRLV